jgi:DNA-binding HxlR family transcriptional regulator
MAVSKRISKVVSLRGDLSEPMCPSRVVLEHLTSRWGVLALIALLEGTHRFSELRRRIGGVSEKMLAQTLQALEKDGFVLRVPLPVIPPHVEYSLSPMGREVAAHIEVLTSWIERSMPRIQRARETVASKAALKAARA